MNIADFLLRQVAVLGDSAAIIDVHRGKRRSFSFRELDRTTAGIASQFRDAGLRAGDGVLLLHPIAAELYLVLIALFRIGCVAIFLDPSAGPEHIERCCNIFPPKAFFGSAKAQHLRWKMPALRRGPQSFCSAWFPGSQKLDFGTAANVEREISSLPADAPALVTFTSGSTAQPKAASRTHEFLLAQHRALAASLELRAGTRDLTTLPIFVLANLASGVTSVLPDADLQISRQHCRWTGAETDSAGSRSDYRCVARIYFEASGGMPAQWHRHVSAPKNICRRRTGFPRTTAPGKTFLPQRENCLRLRLHRSRTHGRDCLVGYFTSRL